MKLAVWSERSWVGSLRVHKCIEARAMWSGNQSPSANPFFVWNISSACSWRRRGTARLPFNQGKGLRFMALSAFISLTYVSGKGKGLRLLLVIGCVLSLSQQHTFPLQVTMLRFQCKCWSAKLLTSHTIVFGPSKYPNKHTISKSTKIMGILPLSF